MRAARLNRRVTLQRPSVSRDAAGQAKQGYTDVLTVWAGVEPVRGDEVFTSNKRISEATHKVPIRRYPGLDATWRVKYGRRTLAVLDAQDAGPQQSDVLLICREISTGEPV